MPKPKSEVEDKEYFREIHFLYEIIGKLKNVNEIKLFLKDLLTRSELRMFKRRWHIACLLDQGYDMREVALRAKTSTSTVNRIKRSIDEGRGGLKVALERTRETRDPRKKNTRVSLGYRTARKLIYGNEEKRVD